MKPNILLTHGVVFAVGLGTALLVKTHEAPVSSAVEAAAGSTLRRERAGSVVTQAGVGKDVMRRGERGVVVDAGRRGAAKVERLRGISGDPDVLNRQRSLLKLIDELGPDEFAAVVESYRGLDHLGNSGSELEMIFRGWAQVDPLGALAYTVEKDSGRRTQSSILETWAGSDPVAAEQWAKEHHKGEGANPYMAAVIRGVAGQDLMLASQMTQGMPPSDERGWAIESVANALMAKGVDAAMNFPSSISDDHLRGSFAASIAGRLSAKDPDMAANWVIALKGGDVQSRASRQVAEALARTDVASAAQFVGALQPAARSEAARGVIPRMAQDDIVATSRWVSTLKGVPDYDRVVESFVLSTDERAPEQSAGWIKQVSDENQQRRLYYRMLNGWANRDPAASQAWVASNQLPQDISARFGPKR